MWRACCRAKMAEQYLGHGRMHAAVDRHSLAAAHSIEVVAGVPAKMGAQAVLVRAAAAAELVAAVQH